MEVAATGGTRGRAAIRNLPQFPPVTHMEPYANIVEGPLQLAEHVPIGIVQGLREFFSIQRKHYAACGDFGAMSYATLHTDLLDRFDEHAKSIYRISIGVLPAAPALSALPIELASTMFLREQQLKSILTALRSSGVQANTAIADASGTGTPQKPPAKPPPVESRKEKRECEATERKTKTVAAEAEAKKTPKGPRVKPEPPGVGTIPGGGGAATPKGACFNFMRGACSHGRRAASAMRRV